jgi:predicted RNase H-like nuclease
MTEKAKQDRIRALQRELAGWEPQIVTAQTEADRRHAQDRVDNLRRDLERAREGKLAANQ